MKNFVSRATSFLLVISVAALTAPLTPQTVKATGNRGQSSGEKPETAKVKTGPEAVSRVKKLKENNKSVRAALRAFEKGGHAPKLEDSWVITDKVPASDVALMKRPGKAEFEKAAFRAQQESLGSGEGEIVFVPTVSVDRE
jgi:hypothetical protein